MMILFILIGGAGFAYVRYVRARDVAAQNQIESFSIALNAYYLDSGATPRPSRAWTRSGRSRSWSRSPRGGAAPTSTRACPRTRGAGPTSTYPGPNGLPFGLRSPGGRRRGGRARATTRTSCRGSRGGAVSGRRAPRLGAAQRAGRPADRQPGGPAGSLGGMSLAARTARTVRERPPGRSWRATRRRKTVRRCSSPAWPAARGAARTLKPPSASWRCWSPCCSFPCPVGRRLVERLAGGAAADRPIHPWRRGHHPPVADGAACCAGTVGAVRGPFWERGPGCGRRPGGWRSAGAAATRQAEGCLPGLPGRLPVVGSAGRSRGRRRPGAVRRARAASSTRGADGRAAGLRIVVTLTADGPAADEPVIILGPLRGAAGSESVAGAIKRGPADGKQAGSRPPSWACCCSSPCCSSGAALFLELSAHALRRRRRSEEPCGGCAGRRRTGSSGSCWPTRPLSPTRRTDPVWAGSPCRAAGRRRGHPAARTSPAGWAPTGCARRCSEELDVLRPGRTAAGAGADPRGQGAAR